MEMTAIAMVQAIAWLCITPNGLGWGNMTLPLVEKAQIGCHKYYATCVKGVDARRLLDCMRDRPVNNK